jgi:hypothetical protein
MGHIRIRTVIMFAIVAAAAWQASGCGGGGGGEVSSSPPPATAAASPSPLQEALNGIEDDGTWSAETALKVFAAVFGPLPGVEAPERDGSWKSGTLALRMVLPRWEELSDEQRAAIRQALGPAASSALPAEGGRRTGAMSSLALVADVRGGAPPGAVRPPSFLAATYQEMADQAAADISAHIGRALGMPIRIVMAEKDDPNGAWATTSGNWGEVPQGSKPTACLITIPPSTGQPARSPYLRWLFLHEVWHCFEFTLTDSATFATSPAWVTEGEASWVAEAITGGQGAPPPEAEHWGHYVNEPGKPLYARAYDAVGFYGQLVHNNIDPWKVLDAMITAGGSDAAFQASGAATASFADRWGSSWFRDSRPNSDWAMTDGYGIPPIADRATPQEIEIGDGGEGTVSAPANAGGIANVHTTAFVTRIDVSGAGRIGEEGGGLDRVIRAQTVHYCTSPSGDCTCPQGSPNQAEPPEKGPARFRAAVTGEQHSSSEMSIRGISKEEWCGQTPAPTPTPSPAASGAAAASCETLLPADDVRAATGIDIGHPTSLEGFSVFPVACVWEDVKWSLQGNPKDPPFKPRESQLAGLPCARRGGTDTIIYCLNGTSERAGGNIFTSRWGFILTTSLSVDEVASKIIPILDRTGN